METKKTKTRPLVVTVSGYPVKDVCSEIEAAIERGDAETACCLASELVLSGMHVALVALLTNTFAQWYVSVDATSMMRVYAAFDMMTRGLPDGIEARRDLVQVVVSMALGLPRQNAFEHVALRAGSSSSASASASGASASGAGSSGASSSGASSSSSASSSSASSSAHGLGIVGQTTRLYSVMQSGRGQDVARLVSRVLKDCSGGMSPPLPATVVSLAFCAIWDACTRAVDECDENDWRRAYVVAAHRMFSDCNATNTKAVCIKRRNIAVCAVLVAASAAAGVQLIDAPVPRCTWRGAIADVALAQAYGNMDAIFKTDGGLATTGGGEEGRGDGRGDEEDRSRRGGSGCGRGSGCGWGGDKDRDKGRGRGRGRGRDRDRDATYPQGMAYLQMYTTTTTPAPDASTHAYASADASAYAYAYADANAKSVAPMPKTIVFRN